MVKKQLLRGQSLHERATLAGRVSLYRIALGCQAAPGLGCGSRAKPVLLELERNPAVAKAWLNRSGTLLAVVGKSTYPRSAQSLLDRHGLAGKALRREERARALEDFLSGAGWYRGTEVDRLSEEEAGVIATRLVCRTAARAALDDARAEMLRQVIAQTCVRVLVSERPSSAQASARRIAQAVLEAARSHLEDREMRALEAAVALGHRPLDGES